MYIIAGAYGRQSLFTPKGGSTRPTMARLRESLFNICQQTIEGAKFLDIFAGSGAMGFEALSRGARTSTFIELNKEALACIERNMSKLNVQSQSEILQGDAFAMLKLLERRAKKFTIVFADPPYGTHSQQIIQWFDTHDLLELNGRLFIEDDIRNQTLESELKNLKLISSRKMGSSILQEYQQFQLKSL